MTERVVIAMSGGVDSSVAAALLVADGYDVVGVSMRLWSDPTSANRSGCCSLDDFLDARRVADRLEIPFYVMDFTDDFRERVVENFVAEYRRGRTPNPCARCNQFVKFAALWERAQALGAQWLATGHYARLRHGPAGTELLRAVDAKKDQSYYLFPVKREVLDHVRFPVGNLTKDVVRQKARELQLPVADKAESQEVCFAPPSRYADFVASYPSEIPIRAGTVVDATGRVLARHGGIHRFTIGQRRGLGLRFGGPPRYVTGIDADSATVRIGNASEVVSAGLVATEANWLGPVVQRGDRLTVKVRARFAPEPAIVTSADEREFSIIAPRGLRAVTPGQAAVLYDADRVVGGGWIAAAIREGGR